MKKPGWMVFLFVGSLLSPAAFADDAAVDDADIGQPGLVSHATNVRSLALAYPKRWHLPRPLRPTRFSSGPYVQISGLDFQDPGALARVSKLRELSLLTIAEVGKARLFFGVSDAGMFGLHLGALRPFDDERCLEVARMPYLKSTESRQRRLDSPIHFINTPEPTLD